MATFYLKSGSGVTEFAQSTAYSQGDKIVPKRSDAGSNFATARKWVWECTTAGTSAAAEPTWPAAVTQDVTTVTSGTATFTARKPGFSSGTTANWAFATIYSDYVVTAAGVGDTIYVSDNHAESIAAAISWAGSPAGAFFVICVDDAAAPPTAMATTATITSTGNSSMTLNGGSRTGYYLYGITFIAGSGASGTASITLQNLVAENCSFQLASTGTSSFIWLSLTGAVEWINCTTKFAAAAQSVSIQAGVPFAWRGGSLLSGGTSPTALLTGTTTNCVVENVDLSNANAAVNVCAISTGGCKFLGRNIKLPASWSGSVNSSTPAGGPTLNATGAFDLFNADNAATNYTLRRKVFAGTVVDESTLVRAGGSAQSWKMVATASALFPHQVVPTPEFTRRNTTTGSAITVTVDILRDSATALTDKDIWLEVSYLSDSGAPLGTLVTDTVGVAVTATDQAASTATWTTTGMSNPNTQKLTVTFTPQLAGFVHCVVKLAKASATVYVDPIPQIS